MEYLNRVLTYLKQELPENYKNIIQLKDKRFTMDVPDEANFSVLYEDIHQSVNKSINRIRNRDVELEFTVKSSYQERDFKILK